jgi:hypothetical protein
MEVLSHNSAYLRGFAHLLPEARAIFRNIRVDFLRAFVLAAGISGCCLLAAMVPLRYALILLLSAIFSAGFYALFYTRYRTKYTAMHILVAYTRAFNLFFLFVIGMVSVGLYYIIDLHVADNLFSNLMIGSALSYVLISGYSNKVERVPNYIFLLSVIPCLAFMFYIYLFFVQLFLLAALWLTGQLS